MIVWPTVEIWNIIVSRCVSVMKFIKWLYGFWNRIHTEKELVSFTSFLWIKLHSLFETSRYKVSQITKKYVHGYRRRIHSRNMYSDKHINNNVHLHVQEDIHLSLIITVDKHKLLSHIRNAIAKWELNCKKIIYVIMADEGRPLCSSSSWKRKNVWWRSYIAKK